MDAWMAVVQRADQHVGLQSP